MATAAHCAYCFESLSASLERRRRLTWREVHELWSKYYDDGRGDDRVDTDDEDRGEDGEMTDVEDIQTTTSTATTTLKPPPAISRLVASGPSSAVSINTSTSSVQSAASSRSSAPTIASSATSTSSSSGMRLLTKLGRRVRGAGRPSGSMPTYHDDRDDDSPWTDDACPLFVTWNTVGRNGIKSLRGCIGTFEAQEMADGLRSYALISAFEDTRFSPISRRELPSLECGVTLLANFQPAADIMAWQVGKHGLRISFSYHGRRYGATYLPDVASDQGWSKEETIVSLMRKAGWSGRRDDWRKIAIDLVTYQGSKATLSYAEWRAWRNWTDEHGAESSH